MGLCQDAGSTPAGSIILGLTACMGRVMAKKSAKKKSKRKKTLKPVPMSKGFGHLTIKKNWIITDSSSVDGGEPDWEGWADQKPENPKN